MGSSVSLVRANDSAENFAGSVSKALDEINFKASGYIKDVVIKPNLCYYWNSSTGFTTDPRIVAGIIEYVREKYGKDTNISIAEADASAMQTKYAFPVLGYTKLAERKQVRLVNLSDGKMVETTVVVDGQELTFKISKALLDSDLLINVPKLKVMKQTAITCAMKNLFGANGIQRKTKYHKFLNEAIVGINTILHPHLTVVDGIVALGAHPIRLNLIMAGTDTFSVDWVASQVMGFVPSRIQFLKLALKEKVGTLEGIRTFGEDLKDFQKIFPKPSSMKLKYVWGMQVALLRAYKRLSGDIIPPVIDG